MNNLDEFATSFHTYTEMMNDEASITFMIEARVFNSMVEIRFKSLRWEKKPRRNKSALDRTYLMMEPTFTNSAKNCHKFPHTHDWLLISNSFTLSGIRCWCMHYDDWSVILTHLHPRSQLELSYCSLARLKYDWSHETISGSWSIFGCIPGWMHKNRLKPG